MPFCCWFWLWRNWFCPLHASILLKTHFHTLPQEWILLSWTVILYIYRGEETQRAACCSEISFAKALRVWVLTWGVPYCKTCFAGASWQERCEFTIIWQAADSATDSLLSWRLTEKKWSRGKVVYYTLSTVQRLEALLGPQGSVGDMHSHVNDRLLSNIIHSTVECLTFSHDMGDLWQLLSH